MAQEARKANPATCGRDAVHKVAGPVRRVRYGGLRAAAICGPDYGGLGRGAEPERAPHEQTIRDGLLRRWNRASTRVLFLTR